MWSKRNRKAAKNAFDPQTQKLNDLLSWFGSKELVWLVKNNEIPSLRTRTWENDWTGVALLFLFKGTC